MIDDKKKITKTTEKAEKQPLTDEQTEQASGGVAFPMRLGSKSDAEMPNETQERGLKALRTGLQTLSNSAVEIMEHKNKKITQNKQKDTNKKKKRIEKTDKTNTARSQEKRK